MADHSHVSGIGGVFFRAQDPTQLAQWYKQHFGIDVVGDGLPWKQEEGFTVFSPFKQDTDYFGRQDQQFMMNFRVRDLDGFLVKLKESGVKIDEKREDSEYGRFAWVYDPENNKIELWEPPTTS